MKIIVFGARGDVGSRIVKEATDRGHQVTAVVRNAAQLASLPPSVEGRVGDASDPDDLAALVEGHDLAISAIRPPDGREDDLVRLTRSVVNAAAAADIRVLVVGGAATLKVPGQNGHTVLTAPGFLPEAVVPIARACAAQYGDLAGETGADWSYLCPPAMLTPGERTGHYRVGHESLVTDPDGNSGISMEDFAVAMIDETEHPHHQRARFTVAY